ncbi:carboxymuconolactone decarboxylase family protein [Nocardia stercoris]|uniref:Carboxymuconolactone decarboxylase family protein n=1 Tax=Nocardia stercoris TaxID=2483361 RepID=A0A3M2L341_9NOCA|nr:carboxymuconolactone decarboxylase family protein [Nocardia stercoris]RMI30933.1 carboxymuconolactone decarboxylase family protein [Nocardia stercoris]
MDGYRAEDRIWIDKQEPEVYAALAAVHTAVRAAAHRAGLDERLVELINVRVSQINGCPFCLNLHTKAALVAGATQQQLDVLAGWRRTTLFTEIEEAALALAETTTELPREDKIDREYALARQYMSDSQAATVVWIATTMGAFNRVSIMSRHPVRPRKEK